MGKAREELESSPYAGGEVNPLNAGSSKVMRESLALEFAPLIEAIPEREVFERLEETVPVNSDGLWRRGSVNSEFLVRIASRLSRGAVVTMEGAAGIGGTGKSS